MTTAAVTMGCAAGPAGLDHRRVLLSVLRRPVAEWAPDSRFSARGCGLGPVKVSATPRCEDAAPIRHLPRHFPETLCSGEERGPPGDGYVEPRPYTEAT